MWFHTFNLTFQEKWKKNKKKSSGAIATMYTTQNHPSKGPRVQSCGSTPEFPPHFNAWNHKFILQMSYGACSWNLHLLKIETWKDDNFFGCGVGDGGH